MKTAAYIEHYLNKLKAEELYRERKVRKSEIDLASNDYLKLRHHETVVKSGIEAIEKYGTTSGGSPMVNGYMEIHERLEAALSGWYGGGAGLIWSSGYSLNYNLLKYLPQEGDTVIADKYMHHSALQGAVDGAGQLKRFSHNDVDELEDLLKKAQGNCFVVMESIYSMDGDSGPLQEVAKLKEQYEFTWILDEAHAVGWYGAGLCVETNIRDEVDIIVGTLGKALVSIGGYAVFLDGRVRDYITNAAKEYMYTTYPSPCDAGCALGALRVIQRELEHDKEIWQLESKKIRELLKGLFPKTSGEESAIIPCIIGSNDKTLEVGRKFRGEGIATGVIRPPSVPRGSGRLRVSINRTHTEDYFANTVIPKMEAALCM